MQLLYLTLLVLLGTQRCSAGGCLRGECREQWGGDTLISSYQGVFKFALAAKVLRTNKPGSTTG